MRILVLGGYGLIGSTVVQQLCEAGHDVVGLGRDVESARRRFAHVTWIAADLATLTTPGSWNSVLREARAEAIVNCAGVLQDGARDHVSRVQSEAMRALFVAAPALGIVKFVQISAVRADAQAETSFMRSKGEADAALQSSMLDWVVLRPGLVISPQAYGGTALLRALASVPFVQPMCYGDRPVQTVAVEDVARAVLLAIDGSVTTRRVYDLVEDRPHALHEVVAMLRAWLGLPPAREIPVPNVMLVAVSQIADALGWLGWRSPLRSTAITELAAGVVGDAEPWRIETGHSLSPLQATLQRMPSTVQERWFARLFMIKPMVIGVLALFWIVTGLITLFEPGAAVRVLTHRGWGDEAALSIVVVGAMVDLGLGLACLRRAWTSWAAGGMIAVSMVYLVVATLVAPDLWRDPLGPLVKVVPAMMLALAALAMAEER